MGVLGRLKGNSYCPSVRLSTPHSLYVLLNSLLHGYLNFHWHHFPTTLLLCLSLSPSLASLLLFPIGGKSSVNEHYPSHPSTCCFQLHTILLSSLTEYCVCPENDAFLSPRVLAFLIISSLSAVPTALLDISYRQSNNVKHFFPIH